MPTQQGEQPRDGCLALSILVSTLCVCATLILVSHANHTSGSSSLHEATQLLVNSGCRCYSEALINTLVTPTITNGGTWDEPTFTTGAISPRLVQTLNTTANTTVYVGPGAGTGTGIRTPYATLSGHDMAGYVAVHTGSNVTTAAAMKPLFAVTFSVPYPGTPSMVQISPFGDYSAVRLTNSIMPYVYNSSATGFLVYCNSGILTAYQVYTFSYLVIG